MLWWIIYKRYMGPLLKIVYRYDREKLSSLISFFKKNGSFLKVTFYFSIFFEQNLKSDLRFI